VIQLFRQKTANGQKFKSLGYANCLVGMKQIHALAAFMPLIERLAAPLGPFTLDGGYSFGHATLVYIETGFKASHERAMFKQRVAIIISLLIATRCFFQEIRRSFITWINIPELFILSINLFICMPSELAWFFYRHKGCYRIW
jgi:hypothetical protein